MSAHTPLVARLALALVLGSGAIGLAAAGPVRADGPTAPSDAPIADLACDSQSLPETEQGRVSATDVTDGRAARGYTCNTAMISNYGTTGGFHVERYDDAAGNRCAYFDSTLLFPKDAATGAEGPGTYVMDMSDPAHPVQTDTLRTPAMLSPHESLRVNVARGLLAADMGYPSTNPGFVDVYDLTADCRHPVLDSSTPLGLLGHESGFSPDGKTFWVAANSGRFLTAVGLDDPKLPTVLFTTPNYYPHGVSISDDGNRMYETDDAYDGVIIFDTSQIQARVPNPQMPEISRLTWPEVSTPQIAIPITENGHPYLVEDDEYANRTNNESNLGVPANAEPVGAARIIDISDEKHPFVVSNLRLAVQNAAERADGEASDPGASDVAQGYAAHYCSVPTRVNPTIMACSMIVSGLRIFDIRDPLHPMEIGYFNGKITPKLDTVAHEGAFAMSSPAYDLADHEIWYSDGDLGFYVVKLTGAAAAIAGTGSVDGTSTAPVPVPVPTPAGTTKPAPSVAPAAPTPPRRRAASGTTHAIAPTRITTVTLPTRTLAFTGAPPYLAATALLTLAAGGLALRHRRTPAP